MLIQTTAPSVEPVTVDEAKLNCKEDSAVEDTLFALWIAGARQYAESFTGRSFITQGWRLVLDEFPPCIELERGNVQSITSITYRDMAGATQTVPFGAVANGVQRSADGSLVADLSGAPARIAPAFGSVWPIAVSELGAVAVNYTAGYGPTPADVPQGLRDWILMRVATLYANREESLPGVVTPLPHVDGLLAPYTVLLA